MATIELIHVKKRYQAGVPVVEDLNMVIPDGSFTVLLGPSGCGKTTTLQMIAGLETISSGDIRFDGQSVASMPPHKRDIAMVFQSYALYPQKSVFENMMFGLKLRKTPRAEAESRVREAAAQLSIQDLLNRKPGTLSGGQRQRVALGRALVRRPRAFLLDEPLSNVDAKLRAEMRVEIRSLQLKLGATFIYVTHDQLEAMTMADQIAIMNRGVLLQVGSPEDVYSRPATRFVAEFIGSPPMNLLNGHIKTSRNGDRLAVAGPWSLPLCGETSSDICTVGVHFEDLTLVEGPGEVGGTVQTVEHLGPEKRVVVTTPIGSIGVRGARSSRAKVGDSVGIVADMNKLHVFDGETEDRIQTVAEAGSPQPVKQV